MADGDRPHFVIRPKLVHDDLVTKTGFGESYVRPDFGEHGRTLVRRTQEFRQATAAARDSGLSSAFFLQVSTPEGRPIRQEKTRLRSVGLDVIAYSRTDTHSGTAKVEKQVLDDIEARLINYATLDSHPGRSYFSVIEVLRRAYRLSGGNFGGRVPRVKLTRWYLRGILTLAWSLACVSFGADRQVQEELVRLVPYDSRWPALFEAERVLLESVLEPWLAGPIEHIGSTAVVGLIAKPVIDIMAGIGDLEAATPALDTAATLGYKYFPYRSNEMHWFCKPSPAKRTHHLHLMPVDSQLWRDRLTFRDSLRDSPETALRYAELKRDLAARYEFDREAYTDGKSDFVAAVLHHASQTARTSSV